MSSSAIYTGHWTDWSYGSILGQRITLTSDHAAILIAFVAFFDAIAGNMAWCILSFFIHQARASTKPEDGLYYQLQALLRNSNEPLSFSRHILHAGWRWRRRAPRSIFRATSFSLLALTCSLLFAVAGIASSQIASTGDVLLRGTQCGTYNLPETYLTSAQGFEAQMAYNSQLSSIVQLSLAYAQDCYKNPMKIQATVKNKTATAEVPPAADCNYFVKPSLNWTITYPNECPFGANCAVPDSEVIRMDTGLLDSHFDLGANQPAENRVLFRRVQTCSPLKTDGFSTGKFEKTPIPGELGNTSIYSYGYNGIQPNGYLLEETTGYGKWMRDNNVTFFYPYSSYVSADLPYLILPASRLSEPPPLPQGFFPVSSLESPSTQALSLFFLANRVWFLGPVDDPWFQATTEGVLPLDAEVNATYFYNAEPGSVLACLEQAQICNPNNRTADGGPTCTDLDRYWTWDENSDVPPQDLIDIGLNTIQIAAAGNIASGFALSNFFDLVVGLGEYALDSFSYLTSQTQIFSPPVPSNQWQIEVNNWFAISLSVMQRVKIFPITGPSEADLLQYWVPPAANDTGDQANCRSQKIKSTAFQSFSVVGLALNFAVGGALLLFGMLCTQILPSFDRLSAETPRRRAWTADGVLQLQRVAYEGLGAGDWEADVTTVPRTREHELIRVPDVFRGEAKSESTTPTQGFAYGKVQGREMVTAGSGAPSEYTLDARLLPHVGSFANGDQEEEVKPVTVESVERGTGPGVNGLHPVDRFDRGLEELTSYDAGRYDPIHRDESRSHGSRR